MDYQHNQIYAVSTESGQLNIMKYPACYIYKRTSDKGKELRYSMRSLKNITNWNGEVFVCGDKEDWFSDEVTMINGFTRHHHKHKDVGGKRMAIVNDKRVPDEFIYMNDDFIIMMPTAIKPLHQGELQVKPTANHWQQMKLRTRFYLLGKGIKNPKDYDIHVPIILSKQKIKELRELIGEQSEHQQMCFRSLYGNIFNIGGSYYKDRKTVSNKLLTGALLSTRIYAPELEVKFPDKSRFET